MVDGNQNYLDNMMLGETVIYCDAQGTRLAAMIVNAHSASVVDLRVFGTQIFLVTHIEHNPLQTGDTPNTWWRRIKQ